MKENDIEIFYPNDLKEKEIETLSGWKLKVATLHFGKSRGDCVRFGYGYALRKDFFDEEKGIHLVADKDGEYKRSISLVDEIDWSNKGELLAECGISFNDVLRNHIKTQHEDWFGDEEPPKE